MCDVTLVVEATQANLIHIHEFSFLIIIHIKLIIHHNHTNTSIMSKILVHQVMGFYMVKSKVKTRIQNQLSNFQCYVSRKGTSCLETGLILY